MSDARPDNGRTMVIGHFAVEPAFVGRGVAGALAAEVRERRKLQAQQRASPDLNFLHARTLSGTFLNVRGTMTDMRFAVDKLKRVPSTCFCTCFRGTNRHQHSSRRRCHV
jgi:hypothetical protein